MSSNKAEAQPEKKPHFWSRPFRNLAKKLKERFNIHGPDAEDGSSLTATSIIRGATAAPPSATTHGSQVSDAVPSHRTPETHIIASNHLDFADTPQPYAGTTSPGQTSKSIVQPGLAPLTDSHSAPPSLSPAGNFIAQRHQAPEQGEDLGTYQAGVATRATPYVELTAHIQGQADGAIQTSPALLAGTKASTYTGKTLSATAPTPQIVARRLSGPSRWEKALQDFKADEPKMYEELNNRVIGLAKQERGDAVGRLASKLPPSIESAIKGKPESNAVVQRMRRVLPSLAAVKAVIMPIANLDPNKVAPICCALGFGIIEVSLNCPNPEFINKSLEAYFVGINTISDWISFELYYTKKTSQAIQEEMKELNKEFSKVYVRALHLIADVQHVWHQEDSASKWKHIESRFAKLTNKADSWTMQADRLKTVQGRLASMRKRIEDIVLAEEKVATILKWIKADDDHEPSLATIADRVTFEGRYASEGQKVPARGDHTFYAQWFFDLGSKFQTWSSSVGDEKARATAERVFWIRGTKGTGKTTIFYRAFLYLKALEAIQPQDQHLRVIPYFCSNLAGEEKRPEYETVLRAIAMKLSFKLDLSVAKTAQILHSKATSGLGEQPTPSLWRYDLLHKLLEEEPIPSKVIILIDGLDECRSIPDTQKVLSLIVELLDKYPQVYCLCSSQQHIEVPTYFNEQMLYRVDVRPEDTRDDMMRFIKHEVAFRKIDVHLKKECIFYKSGQEGLLGRMENVLLNRAQGMFLWVKIWLDILLPMHNSPEVIRRIKDAEAQIDELEKSRLDPDQQLDSAYSRLWKFNSHRGFKDLQMRLFCLALCAFEPLSPIALTDALCIDPDEHSLINRDLQVQDVRRLYYNFLFEDSRGLLGFSHGAARTFVETLLETQKFAREDNHAHMAKLFIQTMKKPVHGIWGHLEIDPFMWREFYSFAIDGQQGKVKKPSQEINRLLKAWYERGSILRYLGRHGLQHCHHIANIKDRTRNWIEVINNVIQPNNAAFTFSMLASNWNGLQTRDWGKWDRTQPKSGVQVSDLFEMHRDHSRPRYQAIVAWLDIIQPDVFPLAQVAALSNDRSTWGETEQLFALMLDENMISKNLNSGTFALHIAVARHNADTVRLFLEGTCALTQRSRQDVADCLLSRIVSYSAFALAVLNGDTAIMKVLLEFEAQAFPNITGNEASIKRTRKAQQWSHKVGPKERKVPAFHYAVARFDEDTLRNFLKTLPPKDINMKDSYGISALHLAVVKNFAHLTKDLVELGANIHEPDQRNQSPLLYAHHFKRSYIADYLQSKQVYEELPTRSSSNRVSEDITDTKAILRHRYPRISRYMEV